MTINRYSASAIHLALSLLVFASFVAVLFFWWFPGDLFFMDGGWEGIKLVAMVDVVLGPLLTLLLFKRGKPSLVFDMSVIACLQIAALAYGVHTTYQQRVVGMVYADNRFNTLAHSEYVAASDALREKEIEPAPLEDFGDKFPVLAFTRPFTSATYPKYLESIYNDFPEIRERSDQYLKVPTHHEELRALRLVPEELAENDYLTVVEQALEEAGWRIDDVELYPLKARYETGVAVFDPQTYRIVDILRDPVFAKIASMTPAKSAKKTAKTMKDYLEQPAGPAVLIENAANQAEE